MSEYGYGEGEYGYGEGEYGQGEEDEEDSAGKED